MRAVAINAKKELKCCDIPEPVSKNGEVIISVKRCGICGSDIHNWDVGEAIGLVMGHEYSGVVTDPGSREDLQIGDRVTALPISPCGKCPACLTGNPQYCPQTWTYATGLSLTNPGGFAEKLAIRPDMVIKVPSTISDDEVAMVEPTAVGLHAIHLADIKVGDKVLVIGGGIIGLVSAMFAKMEGASYVAISETNVERGKKSVSLGVADEWFDARDEKFLQTLMTKTSGGFDVVVECCGNASAVSSSFLTTKPGGTVILVGVSPVPITIPLFLLATSIRTCVLSLACPFSYVTERSSTLCPISSKCCSTLFVILIVSNVTPRAFASFSAFDLVLFVVPKHGIVIAIISFLSR